LLTETTRRLGLGTTRVGLKPPRSSLESSRRTDGVMFPLADGGIKSVEEKILVIKNEVKLGYNDHG
jgi:hypothetical protein